MWESQGDVAGTEFIVGGSQGDVAIVGGSQGDVARTGFIVGGSQGDVASTGIKSSWFACAVDFLLFT